MRFRKLLGLVAALSLLSACNGGAPLLTCRKPCAYADEERDLFCACRKKTPPINFPPPVITPAGAEFDWKWDEAYGCSLNRHYWILNYSNKALTVSYTSRIPGTIDRKTETVTVQANANTRQKGVSIGYEEIKYNGSCFDQDFMRTGTWLPHQASSREYAMSQMDENKDKLVARKTQSQKSILSIVPLAVTENSPRAKISVHSESNVVTTYTEVIPKDCAAVCDSGNSLNCAIKGYPPDQTKLVALRDRIKAQPPGGDYNTGDIYNIFGLTKASCDRSDMKFVGNKLFNRGDYCAFPMYIADSDTEAKVAIHFPPAIKGQHLIRGNSSSGLAFVSGTGSPIMLFAKDDMNADFGGTVTEVTASEKGVYYQTTSTCIFMGVK